MKRLLSITAATLYAEYRKEEIYQLALSAGRITEDQLKAKAVVDAQYMVNSFSGPLEAEILNLDVPLSSRTKPADIQHTVIDDILDGSSKDAFGRLRVSAPFNLFDVTFPNDKQPLLFDESISGGASSAHGTNRACVDMTVGTASGDKVIRQSKMYCKYQPGRSQQVLLTGVVGAAKENVRKRIGYFDAQNGIFLEQASAGLSVVRRTFTSGVAVDNAVPQASWNIDTLDGYGVSGIVLDTTKTQIFVIDMQWLGVGRVRIGFEIGGVFIPVHQFLHANILTDVYMTTATLPVRYEIENTGASASPTVLTQICAAVIAEGGYSPRYASRAIAAVTGVSVGTTVRPLISIRLASAYVRKQIFLKMATVMGAAADEILLQVILNGTLTGAAFASAGSNSIAEADTAATAISGGIVQHALWASSSSRIALADLLEDRIGVFANIAGVSDIITIAARVRTGSGTLFASATWSELL